MFMHENGFPVNMAGDAQVIGGRSEKSYNQMVYTAINEVQNLSATLEVPSIKSGDD